MVASPRVSPSDSKWGLAELIDLEAQLHADQTLADSEIAARDAKIASGLRAKDSLRGSVLAGWVSAIRAQSSGSLPGKRVEAAWAQVKWVLSLALFMVGAGTAAAVLRFTGDHPINVLVVLGVFVLSQVAALLLTLLFFAVAAWAPGLFESLPLVVLARGALRSVWKRVATRLDDRTGEGLGWIRGRRSLYAGIERPLLFSLLQQGAVALNLGVLSSFLVAVTFSDLAFGWGTTLRIGADQLYGLCAALSAPWASWLADATVSMELVRATQYSRFEGDYVQAAEGAGHALAMYGHWWRFLVASIVTYGLLPRLVLLGFGQWLVTRTMARLPPETPEVKRLWMRLTAPPVHADHGADPGSTSPLGEGFDAIGRPPERFDERAALCARWRDAVFEDAALAAFLQRRYGLGVEAPIGSAGGHDYDADEAFLARVEASDLPVFLVAEPWGAPDRALQRFVAEVRARVGEARHVNVVLTEGGSPDHLAIWAGYLAEMADPFLALERAPMASAPRAS